MKRAFAIKRGKMLANSKTLKKSLNLITALTITIGARIRDNITRMYLAPLPRFLIFLFSYFPENKRKITKFSDRRGRFIFIASLLRSNNIGAFLEAVEIP